MLALQQCNKLSKLVCCAQVERAMHSAFQLESCQCPFSTSIITIPRHLKGVAGEVEHMQTAAILQEGHRRICSGACWHQICLYPCCLRSVLRLLKGQGALGSHACALLQASSCAADPQTAGCGTC